MWRELAVRDATHSVDLQRVHVAASMHDGTTPSMFSLGVESKL